MKCTIPAAIAVMLLMLTTPDAARCLTMEEAVAAALVNNNAIQEQDYLVEASRSAVSRQKSAYYPSVDLGYGVSEWEANDTFEWQEGSSAWAGASYNLFDGFARKNRVSQAGEDLKAAAYLRNAVEADVVLNVRLAFIEVLRAKRLLETAREGVTLLERQHKEAVLYHEQGLFARNDVLKVAVELHSARQEEMQAFGRLEVAKKTLERHMGIPLLPADPVADFPGPVEIDGPAFESLFPELLENRSELKLLLTRKESVVFQREAVKGGNYPSVDLSVTHYRYGDSFIVDGQEDPDVYDSETRAQVAATWNIFDGNERKHQAFELERRIRSFDSRAEDLKASFALQLKEALTGYTVSTARHEAAVTAVDQAMENYRVTENQLHQQVATTTDLLDARFSLTRARNQLSNAMYDIHAWANRIDRILERPYPGRKPVEEMSE